MEPTFNPPGNVDPEAVREQLERMLSNPLFKNSKRYPSLLRYVVEQTLRGRAADFKERTLGIEVFGRDPYYETNLDPVVRTTAGEIRKRIAQYYYEPAHAGELRIDLPIGSYVPEFHPPSPERSAAPAAAQETPVADPHPHHAVQLRYLAAAVATAVCLAALVLWLRPGSADALDQFWKPVVDSPSNVLLCVGQRRFLATEPESAGQKDADFGRFGDVPVNKAGAAVAPNLFKLYYMGSQNVALTDVVTLGRLVALLQSKGKPARIRGESVADFSELRDGPVVLVGAFNNDWTLRLTGPLRFSFERENDTFWIKDRDHPERKNRSVNYTTSYLQLTEDYALISRVLDPTTERMVVVAGGLTGFGTVAAGEFLANPEFMRESLKGAPANWSRRNLQVVITTDVINGHSGPPRAIETYFW
jgi:hypothetical protein